MPKKTGFNTERLTYNTLTCLGFDVSITTFNPSPDLVASRCLDDLCLMREVWLVEVKGWNEPRVRASQLEMMITLMKHIDNPPAVQVKPVVAVVGGGVIKFYNALELANLAAFMHKVDGYMRLPSGALDALIDSERIKPFLVVNERREPCNREKLAWEYLREIVLKELDRMHTPLTTVVVSGKEIQVPTMELIQPPKDNHVMRIDELVWQTYSKLLQENTAGGDQVDTEKAEQSQN
jgi:hypothetical protein